MSSPLFSRKGNILEIKADRVLVLDVEPDYETPMRSQGPLWALPFDGSDAEKLAERASKAHILLETELLTLVDLDTDAIGVALHVDVATRAEHRVDDHVYLDLQVRGRWHDEGDSGPWRLRGDAQPGPKAGPEGHRDRGRSRAHPARRLTSWPHVPGSARADARPRDPRVSSRSCPDFVAIRVCLETNR